MKVHFVIVVVNRLNEGQNLSVVFGSTECKL